MLWLHMNSRNRILNWSGWHGVSQRHVMLNFGVYLIHYFTLVKQSNISSI